MPNTYNIGASKKQILLTAQVKALGTPSASRAIILLLSDPTDQGTEVAVSGDATGNIISVQIGDYTALKGKRLSMTAILSITGTDLPTRQTSANNVDVTYFLDQGDDGLKNYGTPFR